MSESYWGVDHGVEISKKSIFDTTDPKGKKASAGRMAAGTVFPAWHGGFAGKKGKKLRSAGNEFGGAVGGQALGATVAAAATKGKAASLGSSAGSYGGAYLGTARAQRMGHYKKQT